MEVRGLFVAVSGWIRRFSRRSEPWCLVGWGLPLGSSLRMGCNRQTTVMGEVSRVAFPLLVLGWLTGFEPATPGITIRCSNQLSYSHHINGGDIVGIEEIMSTPIVGRF